jgi:hypothetical protein
MNRFVRDYALIVSAMAVIFACGVAVGRRSAPPPPATASLEDGRWEEAALVALTRELNLNDGQRDDVRVALRETAADFRGIRTAAMTKSHARLIDLIDRLSPLLEPDQQKKLDTDRLRLQRILVDRDSPAGELHPLRKTPTS